MSQDKTCMEKKQTDFDKILFELSKEVERAESFSIQTRDILSSIKNEPCNEAVKDDKSMIECDFISKTVVLINRLSSANNKQQSNINKLTDIV